MPRSLMSTAASIGARDLLITITQLVSTTADSNFPKEDFVPLMRVWAAREYVTLDEATTLAQLSASAVMRWDIAYSIHMDPDRIDVAQKRRIEYLGRTYDILSAELLARDAGHSIILTTLAKVG